MMPRLGRQWHRDGATQFDDRRLEAVTCARGRNQSSARLLRGGQAQARLSFSAGGKHMAAELLTRMPGHDPGKIATNGETTSLPRGL